jgi:ParB family chromosome partitioning protein
MSTSGKNRFGFDSINDIPVGVVPRRRGGPMSSAVREAADNLTESTEAKVEARKRNASDAKHYREAVEDGRLLVRVPVADIQTDDLPRDRLRLDDVAAADEMEELKASIQAHGQKEPIELYRDGAGGLQLKKGWRRLTALKALWEETGDDRFAAALARVKDDGADRLRLYVDMVEENVLREDLSFAEMAQVAIQAAADPSVEGEGAEDLVNRLYGSLHKMKRSYIRSFVFLLETLGDDLPFPADVSRNLGVEVARRLKERPETIEPLRASLSGCADAAMQARALEAATRPEASASPAASPKKKFEFHVGGAKVTARRGEVRIKYDADFAEVPRDRLEQAVAAFQNALKR